MIVDGRAIAEDIYAALTPFFASRHATLGIVVCGKNAVIESFVRIKARAAQRLHIELVRRDLPQGASTADIIQAIHALSACDGLIVQLPLPRSADLNAALSDIPAAQDVDALSPRHSSDRLVDAPVALAVVEILKRNGVAIEDKRAIVVGAGRLVGAPAAELLQKRGARVSMVTLEAGSLEDLKGADIVVSGAGSPGLIRPEHLKDGVALIDAGTSEQGKKLLGDADPACAERASVFTPVPGGVGPVAVAMIFRNLKALIEKKR